MYLFFNNKFLPTTNPIIFAESKAFRYGELVFETLKCQFHTILFLEEHFNRLQQSTALLHIAFPKYFTANILRLQIDSLLQKNKLHTARVRVTIFKGNGGLFENDETAFNILVETYNLEGKEYELNSNGLDLCFFENIRKTKDVFSNYKTGNHLIYNMAAHYAKLQKCNEALVANTDNNICDSTISNVFVVQQHKILTPPLEDGCIDGILRRFILKQHSSIIIKSLSKNDLLEADEIFLTNTIKGIQWVKSLADKNYGFSTAAKLFNEIIKPLNQQ